MLREIFQIQRPVCGWLCWVLPLIPLLTIGWFYLDLAYERRAENAKDKLLPLPQDMGRVVKFVTMRDEFKETIPLIEDLKTSLRLLFLSFGSAVLFSLVIGLHIGAWTWLRLMFQPFLTVLSYLPPIAILPLIMILLGIGDVAKGSLIFLAVSVPLIRGLILRIQAIPEQKIWSALSRGASPWEMIWIVLRRIVEPGFLEDVRLMLGTAWIYLLAVELIVSDSGLGYRISLAGRNLDMALIFLYVAIICLIAYGMDRLIYLFNRFKNPWAFGNLK